MMVAFHSGICSPESVNVIDNHPILTSLQNSEKEVFHRYMSQLQMVTMKRQKLY